MKTKYILYYCLFVFAAFVIAAIYIPDSPLKAFIRDFRNKDSSSNKIMTVDIAEYKKNLELYTKECQKDDAKSCYNLGLMYVNAQGVQEDLLKGAELFTKACDNGNMSACLDLSFMYVQGHGVKHNYPRAAELFEKTCDAGSSQGCNNLGVMYYNGSGVEKSDEIALGLFTKACEMNNTKGCENFEIYTKAIKEKKEIEELEK